MLAMRSQAVPLVNRAMVESRGQGFSYHLRRDGRHEASFDRISQVNRLAFVERKDTLFQDSIFFVGLSGKEQIIVAPQRAAEVSTATVPP